VRNTIRSLLVAALLLIANTVFAAAELGKDYKLLNPPQPVSGQKIEVLEFFFYQCSHCFDMHPHLSAWEKTIPKDVEIMYVPTMFNDSTEPLARAYYALDGMGQIKQMDDAIYQAIHVDNVSFFDLNSISDFVAKRGVDRTKFSAAYNSFSVQSKVARAKQMIRSYNIQGTPTLVVNGKYTISGLLPRDALRVLDDVIAVVRKERPAAPAESKHKAKATP